MPVALIRRILAQFVFILGFLLMILGSAFLLGNLTGISQVSVLWSFFFVMFGSGCAVLALKLNKRSVYLFFATFFILVGFFLFLSALGLLPAAFAQVWPLISVFSGLALFPAGWHRYGIPRIRYLVPSVGFVILGFLLLVFSFNMVPCSFAQFILQWWPLLVVLSGLIVALIAWSTKQHTTDPHQGGAKG